MLIISLGSEFPNASKGFSRHSSFEQICQVAENEIIKMMSLPSSPTESSAPIDGEFIITAQLISTNHYVKK